VGQCIYRAHVTNDIDRGIGAERHCDFDANGKQWVEERGVDTMVISVIKTNAPFKRLDATIRVKAAGSGAQVPMTM
jgi:hypothetical protein